MKEKGLHILRKMLGNGMARALCGETARSVQCIDSSKLPSLDGEGVCLECRIAYNKEVLPDLDTPIAVVFNPLSSHPAPAA